MAAGMSFSKLVRRTHLLLALFLTPWVLMYALSTIAMHHRALFTGEERRVDPAYELVREEAYARPLQQEADAEAAAERILQDLEMEGAFSVRGRMEDGELTIIRHRPIRSYRITYDAGRSAVRVERQEIEPAYILEMLHRRRGFQQPFVLNDLWAVVVDVVIVAILLWAATGVYMWWEMSRTRKAGAWCIAAGIALFVLFLLTL